MKKSQKQNGLGVFGCRRVEGNYTYQATTNKKNPYDDTHVLLSLARFFSKKYLIYHVMVFFFQGILMLYWLLSHNGDLVVKATVKVVEMEM